MILFLRKNFLSLHYCKILLPVTESIEKKWHKEYYEISDVNKKIIVHNSVSQSIINGVRWSYCFQTILFSRIKYNARKSVLSLHYCKNLLPVIESIEKEWHKECYEISAVNKKLLFSKVCDSQSSMESDDVVFRQFFSTKSNTMQEKTTYLCIIVESNYLSIVKDDIQG